MSGELDHRVVVVTGANSGIGRAAALELARRGATVALATRDPGRGRAATDEVRLLSGNDAVHDLRLDLGDLASVARCAAEVRDRYGRLDVLVNNAGAILSHRQVTADGFEATFGVNHLGHFHLTALLTDLLVASAPARVVNVSSVAHRFAVGGMPFADLQASRRYVSWLVYGRSKLANLLHAAELARRLDGTGVTANACHPGAIRSGFGAAEDTAGMDRLLMAAGGPFLRSPERGARVVVHLAAAPEVAGITGGYWVGHRRHRASGRARSASQAARLWSASEELIAEAITP